MKTETFPIPIATKKEKKKNKKNVNKRQRKKTWFFLVDSVSDTWQVAVVDL